LYIRGKQFALRDRLHKADAIIVLAGTRGNINFLNGKIRTAVHLYQQGWAPYLIFTGKFSVKVTDTPTLFPLEELQRAAIQGRIQEKDVAAARYRDHQPLCRYRRMASGDLVSVSRTSQSGKK